MASVSIAARLCAMACRRAPQIQRIPRPQQLIRPKSHAQRAFTTSTIRWAREEDQRQDDAEEDDFGPIELKKLEAALAEASTPEGLKQLDQLAKENGYNSIDHYLQNELEWHPGWASEDRSVLEDITRDDKGERPNKQSFWFDEEDPETNTEELEEFDEDDITSMAHGKLDEIRDMRQYARLAVWELPLLSKYAKPFVPPSDNQVLRWRYTSYMGEFHPAEKKVVVQFAPDDLKLTPVQTEKLKKLAGPRYNPETEIIKMSSDSFEHQAQNKRYLSNLVDDLIAAAKDPKDTFEDIPLDTRHHKIQPKPQFPKEWRMSPERREQLDAHRQRLAIEDAKIAESGRLIDGTQAIDEYLMQRAAEDQKKAKIAELVPASADVFTDLYDPITETSGDRRLANVSGIPTIINLERIPSTFIQSAPESRRIATEADALILLYDGSSIESLEELRRIRLQVLAPHLGEAAPPTAVVAGKADGAEAAGSVWERGLGEGRELSVLLGAKFGVVSALWGDGVKDVVEELAARVLERKGIGKDMLMGAGP
ncbi:hypothetical protein FGADI_6845 [Fusarium gaditjirri]|uniref:Small ribosomal subunit protein mS35 mitochondrial conserved domain-containing protein n=1 Tax=Fusarium gaditjirri TaxID=282569 RepID=A0A8H4WVV8_9HYPO|nr:hypothetical protein FGADI_6845 [Fusarium gaditjirri]